MNDDMIESPDDWPTATYCGPAATAFHSELLPLVCGVQFDPSADVITPPPNPTATN